MTQHRDPLPPINFGELAAALLAQADRLVPMWLPGGVVRNHEYVCAGLTGGEGASCAINLTTGKWADFATGDQGGDLLGLYAAIHDLSQGKAARHVAAETGLEQVAGIARPIDAAHMPAKPPAPPPPPKRQRVDEGWATLAPVPAFAPEPTFTHPYRLPVDLVHRAEYRAGDDLHGYVLRFRTSDGGKDTLPYTFCQSARDGASRWTWKTWDEPRPLYLPAHALPATGGTVVVVEGEVKADVLQACLTAAAPGIYVVASWPGGCKAWRKAAWAWLAGCHVLLWPDCDAKRVQLTKAERTACADDAARAELQASKPLLPEAKQPGMLAMLGIGSHLRDVCGCTVQLLPIPQPGAVADGWDARDAIEVDGWTADDVLALLGRAQPLPEPQADAAAPAPEPTSAPAAGSGGAGQGGGDGPAGASGEGGGDDDRMPFWLAPYWDADKSKWMVSRKLVIAALTHDPALAGVLGVDLLSNNIVARKPWPWRDKPGALVGADDLLLGRYLSQRYGLPSIARAALAEAIETVAHEQCWHPVQEWLDSLQHDGRQRIGLWLVHVLGETPESLGPVMTRYLALVGRYILLGMVYRVMQPGCKYDYCPVLEGTGGLGKSTFVEVLASAAWYSDTQFDLTRGKEGQEQVAGLWVYELAELSHFGKAEVQAIKAFISAKVDRYRPSYGRVVESYPRQCVMMGTTNESTYLRDRTGNRRFWPVPVRQRINNGWLAQRRDQLFAEAYAWYLKGERYYPTPEEEAELFVPMQESRLVETAVTSELLTVLTRPPLPTGIGAVVNELTDFVTLSQLVVALGVDAAKSSAQLEGQIRAWLEHEGWTRVKRQINGVRAWGFAKPKDWPRRDDGADSGALPAGGAPGVAGQDGRPVDQRDAGDPDLMPF